MAGSARDVGADEGVVNDSAVAGAKFNGFDFPVFCEMGWDDEDLVLVLIVAADGKGFCHGEYEVGGCRVQSLLEIPAWVLQGRYRPGESPR